MEIKLVIFDFDGTLADTRKPIVEAKQETMKRMGLDMKDEEACASTIGLSAKRGFQVLYPELSDEMLDSCTVTYRKLFEEKIKVNPPELFEGVASILEWLNDRGITCTIATSRNKVSLEGFLEELQIRKYFSYVLSGDDSAKLKPDPEPVLKTLRDLPFRANEALVVGDMPVDVKMGKGAGAYVCGVTYGNSSREQLLEVGADYVIDGIEELKKILK